jgi:hypothetical protein
VSIWCSQEEIGYDWWRPRGRPRGGQVRSYANGWSNHYPTTNGRVERRATVDLAAMSPWCVPGHRDSNGMLDGAFACGPWLRLGITTKEHDHKAPHKVLGEVDASVVMDEGAVRALRDQLTEWLDRPKVYPVKEAP